MLCILYSFASNLLTTFVIFLEETPKPDTTIRPQSTETVNSGPRVKHVSRSANKAQGEPAIVQPTDLRLSALPPDEKCKIWNDKSLQEDFSDEEIEQSKSARVQYNWLVSRDISLVSIV